MSPRRSLWERARRGAVEAPERSGGERRLSQEESKDIVKLRLTDAACAFGRMFYGTVGRHVEGINGWLSYQLFKRCA